MSFRGPQALSDRLNKTSLRYPVEKRWNEELIPFSDHSTAP